MHVWQRRLLALLITTGPAGWAAADPLKLCRLDGVPNELLCGSVQRPLDPAKPEGTKIEVHFVVVPALARNKQPDAVLMLAGGPGQSAIALAPRMLPRMARLNNRRDLVFVDQRGTGKSAPLECPDESKLPVTEQLDGAAQMRRLEACRDTLQKLPYGDLRQFTTPIAMQDMDAVREHLKVPQWNLIGGSYGTRAALEYLRQFPTKVRRAVIDGVAPPDMVLPASFSTDGQAALEALFKAHEETHPALRADWARLLASLPRKTTVDNALTGVPEHFTVDHGLLMRAVRAPLYQPALAAALPTALHAAAEGRFEGLLGLTTAFASNRAMRLAMGMHFSVVCAEDGPRLASAAATDSNPPGADFGRMDFDLYNRVCKTWPQGEVPAAFYQVPPAPAPVLLMSGGADPATPPRHGERVAKALAAGNPQRVQHLVVAEAGHGVMGVGCVRDLMFRFIDAKTDAAALPQEAACATRIPRPPAFQPVQGAAK